MKIVMLFAVCGLFANIAVGTPAISDGFREWEEKIVKTCIDTVSDTNKEQCDELADQLKNETEHELSKDEVFLLEAKQFEMLAASATSEQVSGEFREKELIAYRKAVSANPANSYALFLLGITADDFNERIAALEQAVSVDPTYTLPMSHLAAEYFSEDIPESIEKGFDILKRAYDAGSLGSIYSLRRAARLYTAYVTHGDSEAAAKWKSKIWQDFSVEDRVRALNNNRADFDDYLHSVDHFCSEAFFQFGDAGPCENALSYEIDHTSLRSLQRERINELLLIYQANTDGRSSENTRANTIALEQLAHEANVGYPLAEWSTAIALEDDVQRVRAMEAVAERYSEAYPEFRADWGIELIAGGEVEKGLNELRSAFQLATTDDSKSQIGNQLTEQLRAVGEDLEADEIERQVEHR